MEGLTEFKHIPQKPTSGVFGDLRTYVKDPLKFLQQNTIQLGDIFQFRVAYRKLIFVNKPEYVSRILQENHRNYRKSLAYRKLEMLLGNGLFTSEGEFWRNQRRIMQPAFHQKRITEYFELIRNQTDKFFNERADKQFFLASGMTHLTLGIIAEVLLGVKLDGEGKVVEENLPFALKFMIKRITSAVNAPMWLPTKNNKQFKRSKKQLDRVIQEIIDQKKKNLEGTDLLTELMLAKDEQTKKGMSDQQLKDEILTLFLAGHETTAITAFWVLYMVQSDPEVQQKLITELEHVDQLTVENVQQLTYLEATIKETMRLLSPIWVISREAIEKDKLGDYAINPGDSIIFSPYLIHRDASLWEDVEKFKPERFLEQEFHSKDFTYFPFGGGPRICIGNNFALMELKIIIGTLVKFYDFHFMDKKFPGYDFSLTLRPAEDLKLKITRKR